MTFALAALIAFYRGERQGERYPLQDDTQWLERYAQAWPRVGHDLTLRELVDTVLSDTAHWEEDLTQRPGLAAQVTQNLETILVKGMRQAINAL